MAERLGFPRPDPTLIATAISEIARNIVVHVGPRRDRPRAVRGRQPLRHGRDRHRRGPGIRDVEAALRDDVSGRGGLGLGLPGARRLMDDFELRSDAETRHDGDDEEVAVPRRARAPPRGAPPACAERAAREPVEWGIATQVPARRGDERRPRRRQPPAGGGARGGDRRSGARRRGRARRSQRRRGRAREPEPRSRAARQALPRRPARHPRRGHQPGLRLRRRRAG